MDNWRALMRYNVRALMGNSYWLIAVPVAASQLLVCWAVDGRGWAAMHPVLTLQSYSGRIMDLPLTGGWLWNKVALACIGLALFELHRRQWLRPEAPFTRRRRIRQAVIMAVVLLLY